MTAAGAITRAVLGWTVVIPVLGQLIRKALILRDLGTPTVLGVITVVTIRLEALILPIIRILLAQAIPQVAPDLALLEARAALLERIPLQEGARAALMKNMTKMAFPKTALKNKKGDRPPYNRKLYLATPNYLTMLVPCMRMVQHL